MPRDVTLKPLFDIASHRNMISRTIAPNAPILGAAPTAGVGRPGPMAAIVAESGAASAEADDPDPPFLAGVGGARSADPRDKRVVATVTFTHSVDKADLERHIALRMRVEPVKTFDSKDARPFGLSVQYDKTGSVAYIPFGRRCDSER
jgi:hypothetical protein